MLKDPAFECIPLVIASLGNEPPKAITIPFWVFSVSIEWVLTQPTSKSGTLDILTEYRLLFHPFSHCGQEDTCLWWGEDQMNAHQLPDL